MAITIALSFCGTNLLEPKEGAEEPELEMELCKLDHLCAAIKGVKGGRNYEKKHFFEKP